MDEIERKMYAHTHTHEMIYTTTTYFEFDEMRLNRHRSGAGDRLHPNFSTFPRNGFPVVVANHMMVRVVNDCGRYPELVIHRTNRNGQVDS